MKPKLLAAALFAVALLGCGSDADQPGDASDDMHDPDDDQDAMDEQAPGDGDQDDAGAGDDDGEQPPVEGEPEPYFVGRFDHAHFSGARFAWPGSSVSARFSGTGIAVDLEDSGNNHFLVLVDGEPLEDKLVPGAGRKTLPLAMGLAAGDHDVTLYKLTEPLVGETEFHGFEVEGGELLPYFAPPGRTIEIIGDSISAGYGNEGTAPECPFSPATENHYLTYGALAARALGAELVTVAWSGKGVFSNAGSATDVIPMPPLWERTLPARDDSRWDFSLIEPDVVVVNLGTNDFSPNNLDQAPFADAYRAFVDKVRDTYPGAALFCVLGPSLSDFWPEGATTLTRAREAIRGTVDSLTSAGDSRVFFLEFPLITSSEGFGCDYHPTLATHARMAEQLEEAIASELGWR
jgi:lysophospholipase L1-like esterase